MKALISVPATRTKRDPRGAPTGRRATVRAVPPLEDRVHDNGIRAFGIDHVVRLTGLSRRQLKYWDDTGFFRPRYAAANRRSPHSRVYSFSDVVGLRTLGLLRKQYRISLQHLRKVAKKLSDLDEKLWSETVLYVLGQEVCFTEPETGKLRSVVGGQYAKIPLKAVIDDVAAEASRLRERDPQDCGRVERHRYIAHNAWVVAGTRIPTRAIKRYCDAGHSVAGILREYPSLTAKDVSAALEHERRLARRA